MTEIAISNLGIILLIIPFLVHGIEVLFPMQTRWVVNWVLPFFTPQLPDRTKALLPNEQIVMLNAASDAAPKGKKQAGEDYLFLLMFEQRQGAICFTAAAAGALYGLTLDLVDRDALHFMFGIIAVLMMLVNANQAGLPFFGKHPKVSVNGKHVGLVFMPFWAVAAALNWFGFKYALA